MIIIAQVILIVLVIALMVFFLSTQNDRTSAMKKIAMLAFVVVAIVFILNPSFADEIAHFVGIGRGADLLFYSLIFVVIFQSINMSIYKKEQKKQNDKIVRELSLLKKDITDKSSRKKK